MAGGQNGTSEPVQEGQGQIVVAVDHRQLPSGQVEFHFQEQGVAFTNIPGGWDSVVDLLIDTLRIARQEARKAAATRIQVTRRLPEGLN